MPALAYEATKVDWEQKGGWWKGWYIKAYVKGWYYTEASPPTFHHVRHEAKVQVYWGFKVDDSWWECEGYDIRSEPGIWNTIYFYHGEDFTGWQGRDYYKGQGDWGYDELVNAANTRVWARFKRESTNTKIEKFVSALIVV